MDKYYPSETKVCVFAAVYRSYALNNTDTAIETLIEFRHAGEIVCLPAATEKYGT